MTRFSARNPLVAAAAAFFAAGLWGCAERPVQTAGSYPTTHFETPDLTILEPKIPADVTVEGGVPLVTAVGAEGRHVIGIVAPPLPKPELTPEEQKLLGIDPNRKSYYEKLLALYQPPRTAADGVNPWSNGLQIQTSGIAGSYTTGGVSPPVMTIGPGRPFDAPMHGINSPGYVGRDSDLSYHIGTSTAGAQTAENEPKPRAAARDRVRP